MRNQHHVTHAVPYGTIQDAGELAVLSESSEPTRHRYAMVVAFSSEEDLRQAIAEHRCAYRAGGRAQELAHE
ncbi:hypothetical protein SAMN05661010_00042 [Modicisalibacter muralis]|uniref:Uncharacterized protein n=1 Tax=Modicisalibacter muralis TaxID=119000 RepID=A0A1G9EN33_9GAMM|nr:hypothetical protein [Halomonas muralis]SDK77592.1 hypothetical protein SAMN05661010_00042 [Halomonas muralis]